MGHTPFSPSGYDQWSKCTASIPTVNQDRKIGLIATDDGGSEYAREGTVAHALLAICLDMRMSPREFIGDSIFVEDLGEHHTVDAEMGEETDKAYEYIMDFVTPGAQVWVEQKLSLDKVLPGQKGTGDVLILDAKKKRLHVFDLKYGKGHVRFGDRKFTDETVWHWCLRQPVGPPPSHRFDRLDVACRATANE